MTYNLTNNNAVILHKRHKMKRRRGMCANVCLLLSGTVLISLGLIIFIYFESIYDFLIRSAMTFDAGTEPYKAWKSNDPPLEMDIYLFNWTNSQDLFTEGVKPKFEEIGPYRFKEVKEKVNVTWHKHNNTISYRHKKMYWFDAENSVRNLSDLITTINIVPLTIAYKARDFGFFAKKPISYLLSYSSSLFVTKSAGEILFDGYDDNILSMLSSVPLAGVKDKFGLFYGVNNTLGSDGIFSMWTPTDENYGKVVSWNYRNQSNYFRDQCNDVRGSAGEFYPINRKRDYIELFSSELCKIAKLEYETDVEIKGVKGYKYTGKYIFDNGTKRPENECFCNGECVPSGTFNVSSCREGSPTFLSMPHFYNADSYYTDSIEGIKAEDKHEFYITLEPKSGIVIDIGARMQVNMLLQPIKYIATYQNVPRMFVPIFYFDQTINLQDELAPTLRIIQSLPEVSNIAVLILVGLGTMLYVWCGLMNFCCSKISQKEEYKISHTVHEEIPLRDQKSLD